MILEGSFTNEAMNVIAYEDKNKNRKNKNSNALPGTFSLFFRIDFAKSCQIINVSMVVDVHVNQNATQLKTRSLIPIIIIPMICSKVISIIRSCKDFFMGLVVISMIDPVVLSFLKTYL
jgi:hypothetical protein